MPHKLDGCPWCSRTISSSRRSEVEAMTKKQARTRQSALNTNVQAEQKPETVGPARYFSVAAFTLADSRDRSGGVV